MTESRQSAPVVGAVWLGSLLLFALPAFLATIRLVDGALTLANVSLSSTAWLLVDVIALLISVQVATEIAAWRLHGGDWLRRGSRRVRLVRLALAVIVCVGVLAGSGILAIAMATAAVSSQYGIVVIGFAAAFGIAFVASAVRTGQAFLQGYRNRDAQRRLP